ncbi:MAG TPA: SRPBCC family protein [Pyrinomonadaceae bacterium]|nr:SRPBCC family protein [Pyrinomonadaceae bacterium]
MRFVKESIIHAPPEKVFAFHRLPDAIERLTPPGENIRIVQKADITRLRSQAIIEQKLFGIFPSRWVAEHTAYDPPHMFEDVQVSGPFASWRHRHIFKQNIDSGALATVLRDEIEFEPPFSFLGRIAAPLAILPKLEKMFAYRHEVTRKWCEEINNADPYCLLEI